MEDAENTARLFVTSMAKKIPRKDDRKLAEHTILTIFEAILENMDDQDNIVKKTILKDIDSYYDLFKNVVNIDRIEESTSNDDLADSTLKGTQQTKKTPSKRHIAQPTLDFQVLKLSYNKFPELENSMSIFDRLKQFISSSHGLNRDGMISLSKYLVNINTYEFDKKIFKEDLENNSNVLRSFLLKLQCSSSIWPSTYQCEGSCLAAFGLTALLMISDSHIDAKEKGVFMTDIILTKDFQTSCLIFGYLAFWLKFFEFEAVSPTLRQLMSKHISIIDCNYRLIRLHSKNYESIDIMATMHCCLAMYLFVRSVSENDESLISIVNLATTIRGIDFVDNAKLCGAVESTLSKEKNLMKVFEFAVTNGSIEHVMQEVCSKLSEDEYRYKGHFSSPGQDLFEAIGTTEENEILFEIDTEGDKTILTAFAELTDEGSLLCKSLPTMENEINATENSMMQSVDVSKSKKKPKTKLR